MAVYPRYRACVRTGRTACSKPNIQQLPKGFVGRESKARFPFRQMIVPRDSCVFIRADFAAIELVTLAAHCRRRFGFSRLGDAIIAGRDPHAFSAASLLRIDYQEFLDRLYESDDATRAEYKLHRQRAKAANFGVGGGLSAHRLADLACRKYGVEMSLEEARRFRQQLITETYPEIGLHLAADRHNALAFNLDVSEDEVRAFFNDREMNAIRFIVTGDDERYSLDQVNLVWSKLAHLCRQPSLRKRLESRVGDERLAKDLQYYPAVNHAGFARGRCAYTDRSNFPFQSLVCTRGETRSVEAPAS